MNDISLAILRDMTLNNNGFASRQRTVWSVKDKNPNFDMERIRQEFEKLVDFGHLKYVGRSANTEHYCLPEDYDAVKALLRDLNG